MMMSYNVARLVSLSNTPAGRLISPLLERSLQKHAVTRRAQTDIIPGGFREAHRTNKTLSAGIASKARRKAETRLLLASDGLTIW